MPINDTAMCERERLRAEAAEAEVGKLHMQIEESKAYGLRQAMERLNEAKRAAVAEERAEAAEAVVARMEGERRELLQKVQELTQPPVKGMVRNLREGVVYYQSRIEKLRALLEERRYSEDEHG